MMLLRLRFVQQGEKWQQNHSDDCNSFAFELVDLSRLSCDEQVTTMAEISEVQTTVTQPRATAP
jgi:hypothetical protein